METLDRRAFLCKSLALSVSGLLGSIPNFVLAEPNFWDRPRTLWLKRNDVGEEIKETYWANGRIQKSGYSQMCQIMRDVHENEETKIDPALLDVLRGVSGYFENQGVSVPLVIHSGYRTKKTNKALWKEGAAKNSMHLHGKAVDFHIPGVPPEWLARLGLYFKQGGVGLYEKKKFVHLDTGSIRVWRK